MAGVSGDTNATRRLKDSRTMKRIPMSLAALSATKEFSKVSHHMSKSSVVGSQARRGPKCSDMASSWLCAEEEITGWLRW